MSACEYPVHFRGVYSSLQTFQFDYNDVQITIGWAREFETEEGKLVGSFYKKGACGIEIRVFGSAIFIGFFFYLGLSISGYT